MHGCAHWSPVSKNDMYRMISMSIATTIDDFEEVMSYWNTRMQKDLKEMKQRLLHYLILGFHETNR